LEEAGRAFISYNISAFHNCISTKYVHTIYMSGMIDTSNASRAPKRLVGYTCMYREIRWRDSSEIIAYMERVPCIIIAYSLRESKMMRQMRKSRVTGT